MKSVLWAIVALGPTLGCGSAEPSPPAPQPEVHVPAESESAPNPQEAVEPALPADLHAVVFFRTSRGNEHLDVRVVSDDTTTVISGVRADESRGHPRRVVIELDAAERAEYAARIAALHEMPRCEPIGRLPDEPLFHFESEAYNDSGPSLWLRDDGIALLADDDPCLGYVRLAHFVYRTWMAHE